MFLLLTSGSCHVRLWGEAVRGFEGVVTCTRRAWPETGDFLSHGGSGCPFYHVAQCGTESWVTLRRKKSILCLQKITLLSSFVKLAVMITVRGRLSLFFSFLPERDRQSRLSGTVSFLQTQMFAFPCLCCKAINNTSRRDNGCQKEVTMGTDMAETISETSMHRNSCLTNFSSKNSTEKHSVCAP